MKINKKIISLLIVVIFFFMAYPTTANVNEKEDVKNDLLKNKQNVITCITDETLNPTFTRTWGTSFEDYGRCARIYDNYIYECGYCGYSEEPSEDMKIFLIKYDLGGNIIWDITWNGGDMEYPWYLTCYQDHIYLCGLIFLEGSKQSDILILKFDTDGNLIWSKIWGGTGDDYAFEIKAYEEYLYISGLTGSFGSKGSDGILLKYDLDGNLLWYSTWGDHGYDDGAGLTISGEYIYLTGESNSSLTLLKYDLDGNKIFEKSWSVEKSTYGQAINIYNDEIYISGCTGSGSLYISKWYILLIKCDKDGNTDWIKTWAKGQCTNLCYDMDIYEDFIYIGGRTCIEGDYFSDIVILKYDINGELIWYKTWGELDYHEYVRSLQIYDEYIYISGGTLDEPYFDALLLKCDLEGNPGNNNPMKPDIPKGPINGKIGEVYYYSSISYDLDNERIKYLFDWGDGKTTWTDWIDSGLQVNISHSWLNKGEYEIRVKARDEKGGESEWSDPLVTSITKNKNDKEKIMNYIKYYLNTNLRFRYIFYISNFFLNV